MKVFVEYTLFCINCINNTFVLLALKQNKNGKIKNPKTSIKQREIKFK